MRKDWIWQYSASKTIPCIIFSVIAELIFLSIVIICLVLYVINWSIILCVILSIIIELILIKSMLLRSKIIIFNGTTIEVRNLFWKLVKKESINNLMDIRKLYLYSGREWSGEFYCLIFDNVIIQKKNRQEVDKIPHVIILKDTQKSFDFLRKHLPEKWLPYLDQPVEK